ncbi:protease pro-enzyme activation domain-containing protein [Edaphobacter flagellatus]|uniref:protease pro-enzyme activation domain-containing protein n=1 Tax=Edaphobacter flagellatus TaxID=1933044 RepID=UPI0021B385F1|nr:protease pro-enzyme activation domain-containing protein [Edaphobacter flagellatus]
MSISSRLFSRISVLAFMAFGSLGQQLHAASQSRIQTAIQDGERATINKTIPARARLATDLGEAEANTALPLVTLYFNLTDAQQADLTQLLSDQQNPNSPQYHKWLTPQQFGARFGLSSSDMNKVKSWLQSKGLTVTSVAPSMNYVTVSGTVGQIESAFSTNIHAFSEDGVGHISNVTDPQLPIAIASLVAGVRGLNDFKPRAHSVVRPMYTSPKGNHYLAPGDFFTIYDVGPLLSQSINGSGITIAIVGQTDISTSDVATFRSLSGLPTNAPTIVTATGYRTGIVNSDVTEAQLDVEWSGAIAPNATIKFVTVGASSTASVVDALSYAVSTNAAPIISMSYGNCESAWGQSSINSINLILQQANAQGTTVIVASGDAGATDCDATGLASGGLAVDFPSSSPFATAAGGTMFSGDVSNASAYWNSSNTSNGTNSYAGSAKSYIPESPWNESSSSTGLTAGGSGGGGASAFFSKPSWQTGTGVPADSSRDVPDISLAAAASHDGYIVCSQGSCSNGFTNASGVFNIVGGTSAAAPSFAGMLALLEQKLGTGGLGNINPKLYGILNSQYYNNVFHDITSGNNSIACIQGTPNCQNGGSIGFSAGQGYDQASGLGSLDVANLVQYWSLVTPTAAVTTTQSSTTTLTATAATCGLTTNNYSFNVTVASAGSSTTTPTGTVQLFVDNAAVGSPVSLNNGTAQISLDTTKLSSGLHNVSAVYSGDSIFTGSKGALLSNTNNTGLVTQIDVVSTTSPDFSITPCASNLTVASGGTAQAVTLTVTPTAGFTGSINLTANSDTGDLLGYSFSVKPVTITSSSGAVTTQFVLTATVASSSVKTAAAHGSHGGSPWYVAGSGVTLAGLLLVTVPRRRRLGASLLAIVLSAAVVTASGCGGGSSSSSSSSSGSGGGTTTTPAAKGTYNITITGTGSSGSTSRVHSVVLTYTVQ